MSTRSTFRSVNAKARGRILPRAFYARETEVVARELLGAILYCKGAEGVASGRIVETEAYLGEHDAACHAAAGFTPRTLHLYGQPGTAYVYFIYGMHWCVNAVTRPAGLPSAVLIRAIEPIGGVDLMRERRTRARAAVQLTNGPGKLCMALGIDGRHNGVSLLSGELTVRQGQMVADSEVSVGPRIGISRAAEWPLRYFVTGNPFVSK